MSKRKAPKEDDPSGPNKCLVSSYPSCFLGDTSEIEAIGILLKPTTEGLPLTAEGDGNLVDGYVGTDDSADPCFDGILLWEVVEGATLADFASVVQSFKFGIGQCLVVGILLFNRDSRPRSSVRTERPAIEAEQVAEMIVNATILEA